MAAEPIIFPTVTPSQLQLSLALCTRQNQFSFALGGPLQGKPCELTLTPSESMLYDSMPAPEYNLTLEINSQPVQFYIGRGLLNQLLPPPLNDQAIKKLPAQLLKAALVHSLTPLMKLIDSTLGIATEFISLGPAKSDITHSGLALNLTLNETTHAVLVIPTPMVMELLKQLPARIPSHIPFHIASHIKSRIPDIPFWAELILGRSILSRLEISTLTTGDIVFLQQHVTGQQLVIRASRHTAFVGEIDGTQVRIRQRMELMEEQHPETQNQAPNGQAAVDLSDLPVELLFEIGRQQFTAKDILAMQEGYIFDLERPIEQAVRIRANGKVIAECQLVQIENRLGARITTLND